MCPNGTMTLNKKAETMTATVDRTPMAMFPYSKNAILLLRLT